MEHGGVGSSSTHHAIAPSMAACMALSSLGGFLEVASTMCLAYPEARKKKGKTGLRRGHTITACQLKLLLVLNLLLMGVASVAYIVGSWFGPVTLSVPTVMVTKLLSNLLIMGWVLRMERFSRDQKLGTYCIACAIATLPYVGPVDQPNTDIRELLSTPLAVAWQAVLLLATICCCLGMCCMQRPPDRRPSPASAMVILVTAQVTAAVIGTSAAKMLPLVGGLLLSVTIGVALFFALINVISLIIAAKAVDQAVFVPLQICGTLVTNMVTGLIVWQDWRVIGPPSAWVAYFSVHLIMLLGIRLLSPEDKLQRFANRTKAVPLSLVDTTVIPAADRLGRGVVEATRKAVHIAGRSPGRSAIAAEVTPELHPGFELPTAAASPEAALRGRGRPLGRPAGELSAASKAAWLEADLAWLELQMLTGDESLGLNTTGRRPASSSDSSASTTSAASGHTARAMLGTRQGPPHPWWAGAEASPNRGSGNTLAASISVTPFASRTEEDDECEWSARRANIQEASFENGLVVPPSAALSQIHEEAEQAEQAEHSEKPPAAESGQESGQESSTPTAGSPMAGPTRTEGPVVASPQPAMQPAVVVDLPRDVPEDAAPRTAVAGLQTEGEQVQQEGDLRPGKWA